MYSQPSHALSVHLSLNFCPLLSAAPAPTRASPGCLHPLQNQNNYPDDWLIEQSKRYSIFSNYKLKEPPTQLPYPLLVILINIIIVLTWQHQQLLAAEAPSSGPPLSQPSANYYSRRNFRCSRQLVRALIVSWCAPIRAKVRLLAYHVV